jgi:hypothetical protein
MSNVGTLRRMIGQPTHLQRVRLRPGQIVWIGRRRASFLYRWGEDTAVIRYDDERRTCVVAERKLALRPPFAT